MKYRIYESENSITLLDSENTEIDVCEAETRLNATEAKINHQQDIIRWLCKAFIYILKAYAINLFGYSYGSKIRIHLESAIKIFEKQVDADQEIKYGLTYVIEESGLLEDNDE